ncbi:oligopeptide transport system permease protein OppB [Lachnospiraceae bacterium KM106-2]|nr:oligopeptide transport system permease protein OppB [Lachnospiraceae bacterium KM106-2]
MEQNNTLLKIENLVIGPRDSQNAIVKGLSFSLKEGEILGIVGESGSGKSMTVLGIMGLLKKNLEVKEGSISYQGMDYLSFSEKKLRELRGNDLSMIFQEPMTSLNPVLKIGPQIEEVLYLHEEKKYTKEEARKAVYEMMQEVGLKDAKNLYQKYPHELSGGMRQRVMIAMAMICRPKVLFADEPTTALDVTVQAQILELIKELCKKHGTAVIFISHDLGIVRKLCSRTLIMNQGIIVEEGTVKAIFEDPKEDYTKKLLAAVPKMEGNHKQEKEEIAATTEAVMQADHINSYYKERTTLFNKRKRKQVLFDVSLSLKSGETLGIVGESGSGKTTLAKTFLGLISDYEGTVDLCGHHPQMVFQDPYSSLNPAKRIEFLLEEPLRLQKNLSKQQRKEKVEEILSKVGLDGSYADRYISRLSGGQRQRVAIACAILTGSKVLLLDEPVSALDVTIQEQILVLLRELKKEYQLSYLFISHDLNVVYNFCDRVVVMKDGRIVEEGSRLEIYHRPKQEYTKELIAAMPSV